MSTVYAQVLKSAERKEFGRPERSFEVHEIGTRLTNIRRASLLSGVPRVCRRNFAVL